jgi:hypothetical protein
MELDAFSLSAILSVLAISVLHAAIGPTTTAVHPRFGRAAQVVAAPGRGG